MIRTRRGPFMRARTDHLGRFDIDQRLEHQLHRTTNNIEITPSTDRVEQLDNVRLSEGHRVFSFA